MSAKLVFVYETPKVEVGSYGEYPQQGDTDTIAIFKDEATGQHYKLEGYQTSYGDKSWYVDQGLKPVTPKTKTVTVYEYE